MLAVLLSITTEGAPHVSGALALPVVFGGYLALALPVLALVNRLAKGGKR